MSSAYWIAEQRFDWAIYVRDQGGMRALHSRAPEYMLPCPDCGKVKLAVNVERRAWRCFVCGDGGRDIATLIVKAEQLPWFKAVERVLGGAQRPVGPIAQLELPEEKETRRSRVFAPRPWPAGFRALSSKLAGIQPMANAAERARALAYCNMRGIQEYTAEEMRLGVCVSGRFADRLIFPVLDSGGRLLFYQGRAMWPDGSKGYERYIKTLSPRVESEDQAGAGDVLLNLDTLLESELVPHRIAVVEGPIDCAHAWPDAVASFGKKLSPRQVEQLARAGVREIDLCWDSDAVTDALRVAPLLADVFKVRVVHLPDGKDPGDMSKPELEYYRGLALEVGKKLAMIKVNL